MRLIRFGEQGRETPGLLREGGIVDLREIFPGIPDIGEAFFREGWLKRLAAVPDEGRPMETRLGCPIHRPSKIICLGKNYVEHAREGGFEKPESPMLFCKGTNALNGPFDPIRLPRSSGKVDWEVELAVVIGREGKRIPRGDALDYIAGYAVMNDVSGREAQFSDLQWFRGKSFDTFAPLGPAVVTVDEVGDGSGLRLTASVDGVLMQDGTTSDMVYDVPFLLEFISEDMTLYPGDIISTGTPSGVGIFRSPPVVLAPGNRVECRIDRIGAISNPVL